MKQYRFYQNAFDKSACDRIIEMGYSNGLEGATLIKETESNKSIRSSNISWISDRDLLYHLYSLANTINSQEFGYDFYDFSMQESAQFTEYSSSIEGKYGYHVDSYSGFPYKNRKLSMVLQLSDSNDYEGGNLEFYNNAQDETIHDFRKKGTLIVFPSYILHRITKVTKGTRNSLVWWIEGPSWK